jgi:hypothetical protein
MMPDDSARPLGFAGTGAPLKLGQAWPAHVREPPGIRAGRRARLYRTVPAYGGGVMALLGLAILGHAASFLVVV